MVSVVIPFFNAAPFLREALASVLAQRGIALEVLAVDDGSTDGGARIALNFGPRVRCLSQPRSGTAAALNRGVAAARGDLLAFLDADDLWVEEKLSGQCAALEREPELDLIFGALQHFYSPELSEAERQQVRCPPDPMPAPSAGTMLIRRASFDRVGAFSSAWKIGEFVDWYLRAREAGLVFRHLPEVVLRRRIHAGNKGRVEKDAQRDYLSIIRRSLERRRSDDAGR